MSELEILRERVERIDQLFDRVPRDGQWHLIEMQVRVDGVRTESTSWSVRGDREVMEWKPR